jgi:hypothetical protein
MLEPIAPAQPPQGGNQRGQRPAAATEPLSDELVKQVADKVYAMLMADFAIERERQRPSSRMVRRTGGW